MGCNTRKSEVQLSDLWLVDSPKTGFFPFLYGHYREHDYVYKYEIDRFLRSSSILRVAIDSTETFNSLNVFFDY